MMVRLILDTASEMGWSFKGMATSEYPLYLIHENFSDRLKDPWYHQVPSSTIES